MSAMLDDVLYRNAELRAENERLRVALAEIAKGEGRFSLNRHEHACNTIEDMKEIARKAIEG